MRKTAAFLLALCLFLEAPLGSVRVMAEPAAEATSMEDGVVGVDIATPDHPDREHESALASNSNGTLREEYRGGIQVEIQSVLLKDQARDLMVKLTAEKPVNEEFNEERVLILDSYTEGEDLPDRITESFTGLAPGGYVIEISGEGYVPFRQTVNVGDTTKRLLVLDDYIAGYQYDSGNRHPGVLKAGDVDGDGTIGREDLKLLLEVIHSRDGDLTRDEYERYDISGDGTVDLTDLQYFTIFYKNQSDTKAGVTELTTVLPGEVAASSSNAQPVDVDSLFDTNSSGSVELSPEDETDPVSPDNPIILSMELEKKPEAGGMVIGQPTNAQGQIMEGTVEIVYEDSTGREHTILGRLTEGETFSWRSRSAATERADVTRDPDGTIVISLDGRVAIKKVTIRITRMSDPDLNLAEISKVEFLNNMESRIPAPVMNIPKELKAEPGNKSFLLTWKKETNVTGYEVMIQHEQKKEVKKVYDNQLEVVSFYETKLKNGDVYTVSVQSVNGAWKSGYGPSVTVVPKTDEAPLPPENVVVKGAYRRLIVSWKDMEDTDSYSIFYRVTGDAQAGYQALHDITGNSVILSDLQDEQEYEIYLTGRNEIGESRPSVHYRGRTTSLNPPVTPDYKLINGYQPGETATAHIEGIHDINGKPMGFEVADGDYSTSWVVEDWDAGVHYPSASGIGKCPIVTFDQAYEMDTIIIIPDDSQPYSYANTSVYYWPEGGGKAVKLSGKFTRAVSNQKAYYEFLCDEPVNAERIQVNLSTGYGRRISIAELKFYHYDSLRNDIYGLYSDDMHMELKPIVTQEILEALQTRLDTADEVSGQYHPKRELLQAELSIAKKLFYDQKVKGIIEIHNDVTKASDGHITFRGGLNAWQPLGVTAMAGETLTVYVGSPGKESGVRTNLNLIATQYHAEASAWSKTLVTNLKTGANDVVVSDITSLDVEHGGALYIEYTGKKGVETYNVRVSGGNGIPMLDFTKATDSNARKEAVREYVEELEAYVPQIETLHQTHHLGVDGSQTDFEERNCIFGATDIVMKNMMYSVSAKQILSGLSGTPQEKADQLYDSLTAMEAMVDLFYQHKGLSDDPQAGAKNQLPSSRLNIRYMRMFGKAFMYAGGLHVGIEWGSVPGLTRGKPVITDENGRYISGSYFGWGISHEIGHEINEGAYAVAEVTNNYFSVLSQSRDTNESVRFLYDNVYDKVTSGVVGRSSNVFTQLGLYWQLHLAYDMGGYNFKRYDEYPDQFRHLFFARVDSYARDPSSAPHPGGVNLSLNGNTDNKLMRLACAASERNVLEFFERWGMRPDEATSRYAGQFTRETRAIWFANDEARDYAMRHGKDGSVAASMKVSGELSYTPGSNEVKIALSSQASDQDGVLGYEIYRVEQQKNQTIKTPVGFVTADKDSFTDVITTVNNRAFSYEVIGYDKYLNAAEPVVLDAVKVSHGGVIDKSAWTITTNMTSEEDAPGSDGNPCEPEQQAVAKAVDGDPATTYTGSSSAAPELILNLNQEESVTGLTYTLSGDGAPITAYDISISSDGQSWTKVKSGVFETAGNQLSGGKQTVRFDQAGDGWLYAYDASYVKLTARNQKGTAVSVSELDILGETGDNLEFYKNGSIGILKEDYHAGSGESGADTIIPKGSLVFTGTYQGNPAYNVVLLFDETGNVVGGTNEAGDILASQIIFARTPEHGELGETSDGVWVYYIEPAHMAQDPLPSRVRAELYRVDDAHANQGERLVSDTTWVDVPETLPEITINASGAGR